MALQSLFIRGWKQLSAYNICKYRGNDVNLRCHTFL